MEDGINANGIHSWLVQSPEIQTMYSLQLPVSAIRTKIRQEFERHRYVNQLPVVDVLLFQSHSEFQVRIYAYDFTQNSPLFPTGNSLRITSPDLSIGSFFCLGC